MRPSVVEATRFGPEVVRSRPDLVAREPLERVPAFLAMGKPIHDGRTPDQVESVVRRTIVSALMEWKSESEKLSRTFEGLLAGG
jgi:hypothetical protein